jgi:hypothetical protein
LFNPQQLSPGLNTLKCTLGQPGDFLVCPMLTQQSVLLSGPSPKPPTQSLDPAFSAHDINGAALPASAARNFVVGNFTKQIDFPLRPPGTAAWGTETLNAKIMSHGRNGYAGPPSTPGNFWV